MPNASFKYFAKALSGIVYRLSGTAPMMDNHGLSFCQCWRGRNAGAN